jgi:hypothetical protein
MSDASPISRCCRKADELERVLQEIAGNCYLYQIGDFWLSPEDLIEQIRQDAQRAVSGA